MGEIRQQAGTIPRKVGSIPPQVGRIATRSALDRQLFRIQQNAEASSFCAGQRMKLTHFSLVEIRRKLVELPKRLVEFQLIGRKTTEIGSISPEDW
jgi:hypothetical protein